MQGVGQEEDCGKRDAGSRKKTVGKGMHGAEQEDCGKRDVESIIGGEDCGKRDARGRTRRLREMGCRE